MAYWDALQVCWAHDRLRDPRQGGRANAEEMYELCKAAGYSEEAAQRAARQRAEDRMDRELPP